MAMRMVSAGEVMANVYVNIALSALAGRSRSRSRSCATLTTCCVGAKTSRGGDRAAIEALSGSISGLGSPA